MMIVNISIFKERKGIKVSMFILFLTPMFFLMICPCFAGAQVSIVSSEAVIRVPADKAINVNPDTHLELTFNSIPVLGTSGEIRVYDAANNRLVDLLDLKIPAGPTASTPSPSATYSPATLQTPIPNQGLLRVLRSRHPLIIS
jgi:hypothetical protein